MIETEICRGKGALAFSLLLAVWASACTEDVAGDDEVGGTEDESEGTQGEETGETGGEETCWLEAEEDAWFGRELALGPSGAVFSLSQHASFEGLRTTKFSPAGEALWSQVLDGAEEETGTDLAVDAAGVVYVSGRIADAGGANQDALLLAYSPEGEALWSQRFGTDQDDDAFGVAVDAEGAVFVTGRTSGTFPGQAAGGGTDAFVAKFGADGSTEWIVQFGGALGEAGTRVAVDPGGGLYVAGRQVVVEGEGGLPPVHAAMLARLSSSGELQWIEVLEEAGEDWSARAVAVDHEGAAVIAGSYVGVPDPMDLRPHYWEEAFVASYDAAGNQGWLRTYQGEGVAVERGVVVGGDGHVYFGGYTLPTFDGDFEPDMMVVALASDGDELWRETRDVEPYELIADIAVGAGQAEIYLSGQFSSGAFVTHFCPGG